MSQGQAVAIAAGIFLTSFVGAAILIWQAHAQGVPLAYIMGPLMIVLGLGLTALNLGVSDDYLRRNFGGEENAQRMRKSWRGGWIGVLLGIATIAARYFLGGGP